MNIQHISFYRFVPIADPLRVVEQLKRAANKLLGSVLVASEGINGTLAGDPADLDALELALDGAEFADLFTGMRFQRTTCARAPFAKLKIRVRPEIVDIGVPKFEQSFDHKGAGIDVSPDAWDALIAADDVVLLDNRNHFEYTLGHFTSAIDPGVFNYRDFAGYIEQNLPDWQKNGKRIAMYCTGGIRCEKTSQWLAAQGVQALQLQGGILNYLRYKQSSEKTGENQVWHGDCFVFDNRMALNEQLEEKAVDPAQVYTHERDAWRLNRARRLEAAVE